MQSIISIPTKHLRDRSDDGNLSADSLCTEEFSESSESSMGDFIRNVQTTKPRELKISQL